MLFLARDVQATTGNCGLTNLQDKKDDILVGVKSMALRFPDNSRTVISVLSTSFISSLTLAGYLAGMGPLYYLISCGGGAAHLAWQCKTVDFDSRPDCWSKFCSNGWLGLLIWIGIAGDYVVRVVIPGDVVDQDQESGEERNAQTMQIEA
jgi:4-hydroxybenzoate polyprenyltransferase